MALKNLVKRIDFAKRAGISPPSVTELCRKRLKPACVGKKIDLNHPAVVEYLRKADAPIAPEPAFGVDPLHDAALRACWEANTFSANFLRSALGIGAERATAIFELLKVTKSIPEQSVELDKPVSMPAVTRSGKESVRPVRRVLSAPTRDEAGLVEIPADIVQYIDMSLREIVTLHGSLPGFVDWLKATKTIEEINEKRLKNAITTGEVVSRENVHRGIVVPIEAAHVKLLRDGCKTMARRVVAMVEGGRGVVDIEAFLADQVASFIRPVKAQVTRAMRVMAKGEEIERPDRGPATAGRDLQEPPDARTAGRGR